LHFDATTEQRQLGDGKKAPAGPTISQRKLTVSLGHDYISVDSADSKRIWRFDTRRVITINKKEKRYVDDSLYADLAFRQAELNNRMMLGSIIQKAGIRTDVMGSQTALEELFGIDAPSVSLSSIVPKYDVITDGGTIKFNHKGHTRAEFKTDGDITDNDAKTGFRHFLCYQVQVHPEVRKAIVETGKFPDTMMFRTDNLPVSAYRQTLKLTSSAVTDTSGESIPEGLALESSKELGDLIHHAEDKSNKPDREDSVQFAHDALAAGNRLDAMLALMEVGLSSGDKLVDEVKKLNEGADKDPQFQLFIKAVSLSTDPHSSQDAEKLFDQIDRTKLKKAYELDIYKANCVLADGKPAEAGQLFIKALKANPYISGAWADLGDTYYSSFRMDLAWQCWDEARRLSPANPIAAKVNELEDHLRSSYPDFF